MLSEELSVTALPLFEGLSVEDMELIAPLFRRVTFPSGTQVFSKGEEASYLYVLESGEVAICVPLHDGGCMDIATVQRGGIWGWSAALGRAEYTANATCRRETTALAVRGSDLRQLIQTQTHLGKQLVERMAQLARNRSDGLRDQVMKLFAQSNGERSMERLTLNLPAMYGDHHVTEVRRILGALPGVAKVYASAARQRVDVEYDAGQTDPPAIEQALRARGYAADGQAPMLVSARTKTLTEFAIGPGGIEQFVERVPAWDAPAGACPGFEIRQPGDVHPADR